MNYLILMSIIVFLYGSVTGSFLNVCILRIPEGKSIVTERSHCMNCGYQLKWYDMFPIFSYLFLRGKCRQCGEKISCQYPIVEACNGILWVFCFVFDGVTWNSVFNCLLVSALLVLSVIDYRTLEIPLGINIYIFILGLIKLILAADEWINYVIGFFAVSVFLFIIYIITKGKGIGGGDIKLMAAAGILLGWKLIIFAFIAGCLYGSVIHITRMKISGEGHVLAMGPYLSMGILSALWFGNDIIEWYLGLLH